MAKGRRTNGANGNPSSQAFEDKTIVAPNVNTKDSRQFANVVTNLNTTSSLKTNIGVNVGSSQPANSNNIEEYPNLDTATLDKLKTMAGAKAAKTTTNTGANVIGSQPSYAELYTPSKGLDGASVIKEAIGLSHVVAQPIVQEADGVYCTL